MPDSLVDETPLVISPTMPELAIAEMCCHWWARSEPFKSVRKIVGDFPMNTL
jgi:hypothetical protein